MKFCKVCRRSIKKRIVSNSVVFKCECGHVEATNPEDVLISSETLSSTDTTEWYNNLIHNAPHDKTCQLVKQDCPDCGLDYLTQLRLGNSEIVVHRCKCGYKR
jgi:DNA-directed RNA polymerase subunit M/transcription elongation factor TFIIS